MKKSCEDTEISMMHVEVRGCYTLETRDSQRNGSQVIKIFKCQVSYDLILLKTRKVGHLHFFPWWNGPITSRITWCRMLDIGFIILREDIQKCTAHDTHHLFKHLSVQCKNTRWYIHFSMSSYFKVYFEGFSLISTFK